MATNAFHTIQHPLRRRRHSFHSPPTTATAGNSFSPKFPTISLTSSAAFATAHSTSTTSTSSQTAAGGGVSFDLLRLHLSSADFRQADEETRRLIIALAGDSAVKRGYVFFSEVQFISAEDLKTIDELWREHSGGRFGYSVQKKIWKKAKRDFTSFFIKVGWMKKLESSEVEQWNYRAFPTEFVWELEEGTPEGHLPLTNALRGTQLLNSILTHPAFQDQDQDQDQDVQDQIERESSSNSKTFGNTTFKPNYSF